MAPHTILTTIIFFLGLIKTSGQNSKTSFGVVDSIVLAEMTSEKLQAKLDNLRSEFIPSRSTFSVSFDRDIDFAFRHHRINVQLNFESFQIDLLTRNDTIFARTIRHYYNPYEMDETTLAFDSSFSLDIVGEYLTLRNKFYKSHKTAKDLIKEISEYRVFAFYCGDGSPFTEEGKQIKEIVAEEKQTNFFKCCKASA